MSKDVWEQAAGFDKIHRGDRIQQHDLKKKKEENALREKRLKEMRQKEAELKKQRTLKARTKRGLAKTKNFLVGPKGLLRKDLAAPFKKAFRRR